MAPRNVIANEPGVLLLDDRRVFVAANEAAATLLATTPEDLLGLRADNFMPMVARPLYPLAWRAFLLKGSAAGDYAAALHDGSLSHLAYVGFANRPVRGLHFFVLRPLEGRVDDRALVPVQQSTHIQVGAELPEDLRQQLTAEADREEWRLPVKKEAQRAVLAALFRSPSGALEALGRLRQLESAEVSLATAAGSTQSETLTIVAGRVPYQILGTAIESLRGSGGRIVTNLDERLVDRGGRPQP